jgi:hypothetical protein
LVNIGHADERLSMADRQMDVIVAGEAETPTLLAIDAAGFNFAPLAPLHLNLASTYSFIMPYDLQSLPLPALS